MAKIIIGERPMLADFWEMPRERRQYILLDAIRETHAWHYLHNAAYRTTLSARDIGANICLEELPRLLRPTAQTFKSYIDLLGTPFPQDCPREFIQWLAGQISIALPLGRMARLESRYPNLEALLGDIEAIYSDLGFELSTSSGTSGRATIMLRDQDSINKTVDSFYLCFQRYFKLKAEHRAVFVMPLETRIAMVRMANFSVRRVGIPDEHIHFSIPFPAHPDQVRIRAGRTFRAGWHGWAERRFLHPFMNWMNEHYVNPQAVKRTLALVDQAAASSEKLLLFGGWVHLHALALELRRQNRVVHLPIGSLIGTGGGLKERYPYSPDQITHELAQVFLQAVTSAGGGLDAELPVPLRDVYGMAEANWAAMQCRQGNYHIPPWIYAVTLDEDARLQFGLDTTGILAFYDPFGGGTLFPSFFKTADRVRLINGDTTQDRCQACSCGEPGAYLARDSILRVDLFDEAGCAAVV